MNIEKHNVGSRKSILLLSLVLLMLFGSISNAAQENREALAQGVLDYYEQMSDPKPLLIRKGQEFAEHRDILRQKILECMSLSPLPERVPLDIHESEAIDHPWCTIKKVAYQIWPNVYSTGVLYMPKNLPKKPAPAILCVHGHWNFGYADHQVQKRSLTLAKKGFVVFSPPQDHYENLEIGVSHQTHHVWRNMRALDYLQSLPEVDKNSIGVCGASGGGLQTQMMVGLDDRVKAATIVGLTCDYREILFPYMAHCGCNHFPNIMKYIDQPEITTLGIPAAIQYLIMNDWSRNFGPGNFPTIQELYNANGVSASAETVYWPTGHSYDKPKRERTYWWMQKWVQGNKNAQIEDEPDDLQIIYPEKTLLRDLTVDVPNNKGLGELGVIYNKKHKYKAPEISNKNDWRAYKNSMTENLKVLLGEDVIIASENSQPEVVSKNTEKELIVERINFPTEASIKIPCLIVKNKKARGRLPVTLMLSEVGKDQLLAQNGAGSARDIAEKGSLVVLADIRFVGELDLKELAEFFQPEKLKFKIACPYGPKEDKQARDLDVIWGWSRNSLVWGRSMAGMAVTDIQAVLDGVALRSDVDMKNVSLIAQDSGILAAVALFAAVLDQRISTLDVDFKNGCFEMKNLGYHIVRKNQTNKEFCTLVPNVLRYGDILQWACLLADKRLTIRNIPPQAGDSSWLKNIFTVMNNTDSLKIIYSN